MSFKTIFKVIYETNTFIISKSTVLTILSHVSACGREKIQTFPKLCRTKDHPDLGAKVRHKYVTIKILELN